MKLDDLSSGERLILGRRRRGLSQLARANFFGVTLYRYRAWEDEKQEPPARKVPKLGKLHDYEACYVLRRRRRIALQDLVAKLDVTPNWLCEIEHGRQPAGRLLAHWRRVLRKKIG